MAEAGTDQSKEELLAEAEKRGLTGLSRATKAEVQSALEADGWTAETPSPTPDDEGDDDDDGEEGVEPTNPNNQGLSAKAGDPPFIVMGGRHPDENRPDSPQGPQVEPLPAVRAGQRDSLVPQVDEVEYTDDETVTNQSDHYKEVVVEGHGRFGIPSGASLDLSSRQIIPPGPYKPPEDAPDPSVPEGIAMAATEAKLASKA